MTVNLSHFSCKKTNIYDRKGTLKKEYIKMYVSSADSTWISQLLNRGMEPHKAYKKYVLPLALERLKNENPDVYELVKGAKWTWNQYSGCSMCRCSPGFVASVKGMYDINVVYDSKEK